MSENGTNTSGTVVYDYSSYELILETSEFTPCNTAAVNEFGKVFLPMLYSLVFILGFMGNGLVVCVLLRHWQQSNLTDICLLNLAVSDLLFVLTLPLYSHYARAGEWPFGEFMCRFTSIIHSCGFFSSIFFMVVMTLDRYLVIMHTFTMARYRTLRAGIVLTVVVWMLSLSVSLPSFIFTKVINQSDSRGCYYAPENNAWKLYDLFATIFLGLVIPLLVMVVCYSRIIPTLVNMKSTKKHRVIKLIISIVVAFFVFWSPYDISLFLRYLKSTGKLPGNECTLETHIKLALTVTEAFSYTHCCLNPIIYAFVAQKFMKRALQLLRSCVPGLQLISSRDMSESSYRKSSVMSRSSDVNPTFIK